MPGTAMFRAFVFMRGKSGRLRKTDAVPSLLSGRGIYRPVVEMF
jgi:hypothetical protein